MSATLGALLKFIFAAALLWTIFYQEASARYEPTWESLDKRPLPSWYDGAKFGIFIHWGVYSVPAFKSEWFWWYWKGAGQHVSPYVQYMSNNFKPNFSYADFGPMFTAEFFDADQWADIFRRSGAKYVVLTSKHHEGYTLWPSKFSWNWNSMDVGPHRDIVDELSQAVRRKNLTFGLYYSQFEWFNPLWNEDAANNFTSNLYPKAVSVPHLYELVEKYKPDVVWSDGDSGPDDYWKSKEFLAWLYNDSPVKNTVVVNDRWGFGTGCKHGGYFTCADRYSPDKLQTRKWENCMTVQRNTWGFDRTARLEEFLTGKELIKSLVDTVSYGGNLLLNVGPTHDGRIVPIFEERLYQIGDWLFVNGEAIYDSNPWFVCQNDTITPEVWYTSVEGNDSFTKNRCLYEKYPRCLKNKKKQVSKIVYATFFNWPADSYLTLGCPEAGPNTEIAMLGVKAISLKWKHNIRSQPGIIVDLLPITFQMLPSMTSWTLKITNLKIS